jgi:hypothetical protein
MTLSVLQFLAAQLCVGTAALAATSPMSLRSTSRLTKLALLTFLGLSLTGLFMLTLLCFGVPFDARWIYGVGALSAIATAILIRRFRLHWAAPRPLLPREPWPLPLTIGFLFLAGWMFVAALCLPSVDYDSIAIWSYRVRVLLSEGTLYTDSLRSPWRIAPMPKHPYFLPVVEALACAGGGFSQFASHIPHLLLYATYVLLVMGAARELFSAPKRFVVLAALLCMPAPAVQWWLEGAREPAIGVATLWSVYWLTHWLRHPSPLSTFLCAVGLAVMYHIKVEGVAVAAGTCLAFAATAMFDRSHRRLRLSHVFLLIALLAITVVPWQISKHLMPPSPQDYDFTAGFSEGWLRRLPLIPYVCWMGFSEVFLRPELYGIAPHLAVLWLFAALRRASWRHVVLVLLPPILCLVGILAIYVVRQEQLGAARNVTFSRRFVCVVPALVFAAAYLSEQRKSEPRSTAEQATNQAAS